MKKIFLSTLLIFFSGFLLFSYSKKNKKVSNSVNVPVKTDSVSTKKETPKDIYKPSKDITDKCKHYYGLFPIHQDTVSGKTYIEISEDKINREFIYFCRISDASADVGYTRGAYRDSKVFRISKYFDRIDFTVQNTQFYFAPDNAISASSDANINKPLVFTEKISGVRYDTLYNEDSSKTIRKHYLIDADGLFLQENIVQVKPSKRSNEPPNAFVVGNMNSKKNKILSITNYPENSDVEAEYIYENPYPTNFGSTEATDARFLSVRLRHSIIAMPDDKYVPRYDDPRVGYFLDNMTDMTSMKSAPYRDLINRWRLEKKYPSLPISEPIHPITYYMDKNTPVEWRPVIKAAVEQWNIAFEAAGFKNAVVCLQQPDTATWDAGDIRYNVLSWTASPNPPFGGYGPSFSNPRTGEILGADIMLEWIYLSNRFKHEKLFDIAGLQYDDENNNGFYSCNAGYQSMLNIATGNAIISTMDGGQFEKDEYLRQALTDLVMHEVGHTLGLNHNFIASYMNSPKELEDKNHAATIGLTASVMDYTVPNLALHKDIQGQYFDTRPGPYDIWAIRYGYTPIDSTRGERATLEAILQESSKPNHLFFPDADDMRNPGKGIDPRVMLYDMSSDPLHYAEEQILLINTTFPKIFAKYTDSNQSYHDLRNAYLILNTQYSRNLTVISRWIGGVYVSRNFTQQNNNIPFTPVEASKQKLAMALLAKYAFGKDAFQAENYLYKYLQSQRRGNDRPFEGEDPKIHDRILNIQKGILDHVLHPNTLQRIVDSKLYGNSYTLPSVMSNLSNAIFKDDINNTVNSQRQNLQTEYLKRLLTILSPSSGYANIIKANTLVQVSDIKRYASVATGDAETQAHKKYLLFLIQQALEK